MPRSTLLPIMLVCLAAIAFVSPGKAQTTLLFQDFDGDWSTLNPPAGWRIGFSGDTSTNDWHRRDSSSEPWTDNNTPYAAMLNTPQELGADSLITPVINCEDYNVVVVRCSTRVHTYLASRFARLLGSVDGGPFDHRIASYEGGVNFTGLQTFDISSWAKNQPEVRLLWRFNGDNATMNYWCVDNVTVTGDNSTSDVGIDTIFAPIDTVDSGAVVIPEALVKNFAQTPVTDTFRVEMRIGTGYRDTTTWVRETIPPGSSLRLSYPTWTALPRGRLPVSSETFLYGDINQENNAKLNNVFVEVRDVGVLSIVSPADTVDSAVVINPEVEVRNFGNADADSFRVHFTVGSKTYLPEPVTELPIGEVQAVTFAEWYPDTSGVVMARCSVYWYDDINPRNDTFSKRFFVKGTGLRNIGAVRILVPSGAVRESILVAPKGLAVNQGSLAETFEAYFEIRDSLNAVVYEASSSLTLPAGQADTASFAEWNPAPEGNYTAKFYVVLEGDQDPSNDTVTTSFQVLGEIHDVSCEEVLSPAGRVKEDQTVRPSAEVMNRGDFTESFTTLFSIYRGASRRYTDSTRIEELAAGSTQVLNFGDWTATEAGQYYARCSTMLVGDENLSNNLKVVSFVVEQDTWIPGWEELTQYPSGVKGIGKGAGLAYMAGVDAEYVYGTRGYKLNDFYRYNIATEQWEQMAPVPGGERPLYTGGCLDGDRYRYVYCVRGNRTVDFLRYDCAGDSWSRKKDIPLGPDDREVKKGSDLEPVWIRDTLYMYLLKGDKLEFYRYNTVTDEWEARTSVPLGIKGKVYRGSFIVWDGDNTIYFFKAKYNETWAYNVSGDFWIEQQLLGMPFVGMMGRKKKMKDGAAGCWYEGKIICMKGGNTQECWEFDPEANTWFERDTIPAYGSTGRKKRVKYGGDMQTPGNGRFYVTKGNKTLEFWRYNYARGTGIRSRGLPESRPMEPGRMTVMPNPARGRVNLALPGIGAAVISVYDIHGARLGTTTTATGRASLDLQGLSPGVYFVHADYGSGTETTKLIVE
ncbi:MAG: T9SS type A sorting domain-containing protein [candidate division WOR-3 bacterium]|nr:MAG: T9SS type A sorting domain-containing protein [candidate division WOR-3 bacterium]